MLLDAQGMRARNQHHIKPTETLDKVARLCLSHMQGQGVDKHKCLKELHVCLCADLQCPLYIHALERILVQQLADEVAQLRRHLHRTHQASGAPTQQED
jgi:hypothetical protein